MKWREIIFGPEPPLAQNQPPTPKAHHTFAIGDDYETWKALVNGYTSGGRVSRAEAMAVPAIKSARDIFCGTIGSLPIHNYRAGKKVDNQLLVQPESLFGFTRSVTMARTLDDLFFEGKSLWTVEARDTTGFPSAVERPRFGTWNWDNDRGVMKVGDRDVKWEDCILFTSPNDPICTTSAPTVRALLRLEASAAMYIDNPEMMEYFTPTEGQEPEEEEIEDFLEDWKNRRRKGITGFIPGGIQRHEVKRLTGKELQLIEAREFSIAQVSRLTGISPNWLALNITSRTYNNSQDERRQFIDFAAAPYIKCVEERLSLPDVTPRGQYAKWNLNAFLRANTKERYETYEIALRAGFLTIDEIRNLEDLGEME